MTPTEAFDALYGHCAACGTESPRLFCRRCDASMAHGIRMQLAACHEAMGEALALIRQQSYGTAAIVLEDALKGKK